MQKVKDKKPKRETSGKVLAPDKEKAVATAVAKINKTYGEGTIMSLVKNTRVSVDGISTGWTELDDLITGATDEHNRTIAGTGVGIPRGRIIEVYGDSACLDAATFIQYEVRHGTKTLANCKGGTIERLYERFHKLERRGKGYYQRRATEDCEFFAPSVDENNRVFQNRIVDVVKTGARDCYEVRTKSGQKIVATADHKFYIGTKYVPLKSLRVGMTLMVHDQTRPRTPESERYDAAGRVTWFVKHHPLGSVKVVKDRKRGYANVYKRIARARAVVEAQLNGLTPEAYRKRLNAGDLKGLVFLTPDTHVHHINEDHTDDRLENLATMPASEHLRHHMLKRGPSLRHAVSADEIVKITHVGLRETYDLRMESPYNNYVANKLVVHNSGKTTLMLTLIKGVQDAGGVCAYIDAEHALDLHYAENIGVNKAALYFTQPNNAEEALSVARDLAASGAFDLIVVDSVAALVPEAETEADFEKSQVALQARLMSKALRTLGPSVSKSRCVLAFVNQTRMKIGVFFGNPMTTPGGRSLPFYASVRLETTRVKTLKKGDRVSGSRIRIKVVKNKVAPPFREIHADLMLGKGYTTMYREPVFGKEKPASE